jgi:gamma-glutamyltranspeptidase/glutathione hydrolase
MAETSLRAFSERERWAYDQGLIGIGADELVADYHIDELMDGYRPDLHVPPAQLGLTVKPLVENPSAASMVAVDRSGSAAACAVTLNSLFGTGRIAPGTGIVLASMPGQGGRGATGLGPMLVVNDHTPQFRFAAAASGGAAAPVAMVQVAAETLLAGVPLGDAMATKRVLGGGDPDVVYFEQLLPATDLQNLSRRGHQLVQILSAGTVNAISCPGTIPEQPETCAAATDPRGFGLAATAD